MEAEGCFTNDGDMFGPGRKEYLQISFENGKWQALKIVGDSNVPRGKISFRTVGEVENIEKPTPAEVQVRTDVSNPDGFYWIETTMRFDHAVQKWFLKFYGREFSFTRVPVQTALEAAKNPDYPQGLCIVL